MLKTFDVMRRAMELIKRDKLKSKTPQLKAFYDGSDTIVAETVAEAMELQRKANGMSFADQNPVEEWLERDYSKEITIRDDETDTKETHTVRVWIRIRGKGLLCSENY